jgi:hypothetical protein
MSVLDTQVGGDHYKNFKIQPWEFIEANGLGFTEGNIIKYITQVKNGEEDIDKAGHYLEGLIEFQKKKYFSPILSDVRIPAVDFCDQFDGATLGSPMLELVECLLFWRRGSIGEPSLETLSSSFKSFIQLENKKELEDSKNA